MTRNEERIKQILSEYNLNAIEVHYDKPKGSWEWGGPDGGWLVVSDKGHYFVGFNIGELIEDIRFEMEVKSKW